MAEKDGKKPSDVKVAVAVENDPFSLDVRAGVIDDAKKYDMKIVIDDKLPRDLSDMSAILTKVKLVKPDVLIVSGHSKGAATAVRQINEHEDRRSDDRHHPLRGGRRSPTISAPAANDILCSTQWAETLSYEDPIFGTAADYERGVQGTFPEATRRCPTSRPRRLPP